jgi:hypothetical protein
MKAKYIYACLTALMLGASLTACSDDDEAGLLRPVVDVVSNATTVSSLTFRWPDRGDAVSWHYDLKNADGEILASGDLPADCSRQLVFTGLTPASKYSLDITAYDADGNSETSTYVAYTNSVVTLSAPSPVISQETNVIYAEWSAVTNAASYYYEVKDLENELYAFGYVTNTYLEFDDLEVGEYVLFIKSISDNEAYATSAVGEYPFTRSLGRMWLAPGDYTSSDGSVYHSTICGMEDGSYLIENFYGAAGYNLEFTVNRYNTITITNGTETYDYCQVQTGVNGKVISYAIDESVLEGDQYSGSITFVTDEGEDTYTWEAVEIPDYEVSLDAMIYKNGVGYSDYFWVDGQLRNYTLTVPNFLGSDNTYIFSYDPTTGTTSTSMTVGGFCTGPFVCGDFCTLNYIYMLSSAYCTFDVSQNAFILQFWGYEDSGTTWMTLYIYLP